MKLSGLNGPAARAIRGTSASAIALFTKHPLACHLLGGLGLVDTWTRYNGHMNELRMLADEVGVSERTLRRATDQGTLRATRIGPRTLELPLSERVYVRRSWPLISALRTVLRTESNVRFAMLFGSTATGTDTRESDVDVLVDLRDASLERLLDLQAKLVAVVGRDVDVVRLADAEDEPALFSAALAEGRVLVDRAGLWPALRRRESLLRRRGDEHDARRVRDALAGIDRLLAV
jgi:predicted nucleotidyltransferase